MPSADDRNSMQAIDHATAALRTTGGTENTQDSPLDIFAFVSASDTSTTDFHITEVLGPKDPRVGSQVVVQAKRLEVHGLLSKDVFEIVDASSVPEDANVLCGSFMLSMKSPGTQSEKKIGMLHRPRAQGFRKIHSCTQHCDNSSAISGDHDIIRCCKRIPAFQ